LFKKLEMVTTAFGIVAALAITILALLDTVWIKQSSRARKEILISMHFEKPSDGKGHTDCEKEVDCEPAWSPAEQSKTAERMDAV